MKARSVLLLCILSFMTNSVDAQVRTLNKQELKDSINIYRNQIKLLRIERRKDKKLDRIKHKKYQTFSRHELTRNRQVAIQSGEGFQIHFVGDGNIQNSLTNNSTIQSSTGLGVIIHRDVPKPSASLISSYEFDITINVASSLDTVVAKYNNKLIQNAKDFGTSILIPRNSARAAQASFKGYFSPQSKLRYRLLLSGIRLSAVGSARNWEAELWESEDSVGNRITVEAATMALKAGFFHDFVPNEIRMSKKYSVLLGFDFSMRWLFGDLDDSKAFGPKIRNNIFGKNDKHFFGVEPYIAIKLRNITAEVSIPYLDPFGSHIPGLTGAQFLTTIRFVGGFPVDLKSN